MSRLFALLFGAALAWASAQTVIPYDSTMMDRVSVDGMIDSEDGPEYPATYADKASGLTVHWGFDDSLIYVGTTTKGRGWLAVGFGSPKMNESNMIIGYYAEDSTEVMNQVGANHTHARLPQSDTAIREAEIDFDEETGVTTMEFIYPLQFPAGEALAIPGLSPGGTYDIILAQNTKTIALGSKHTNTSVLKVKLADKPQPPAEPKTTQPQTTPEPPPQPEGQQ